jgi:hypothetical protein
MAARARSLRVLRDVRGPGGVETAPVQCARESGAQAARLYLFGPCSPLQSDDGLLDTRALGRSARENCRKSAFDWIKSGGNGRHRPLVPTTSKWRLGSLLQTRQLLTLLFSPVLLFLLLLRIARQLCATEAHPACAETAVLHHAI